MPDQSRQKTIKELNEEITKLRSFVTRKENTFEDFEELSKKFEISQAQVQVLRQVLLCSNGNRTFSNSSIQKLLSEAPMLQHAILAGEDVTSKLSNIIGNTDECDSSNLSSSQLETPSSNSSIVSKHVFSKSSRSQADIKKIRLVI